MFWLLLFPLILIAIVVVVVFATRNRNKAVDPGRHPGPTPTAGGAGWYTQPDGTQRYWDGTQWTDHTAP